MQLVRSKLLYSLGRKDEARTEVMHLLRNDPMDEDLWVHLHLFTSGEESTKALFKAYDINPSSALVLNCLLTHYLSSGQIAQFFQALQMAKKYTTVFQNPHVLSLLHCINGLIGSSEKASLNE